MKLKRAKIVIIGAGPVGCYLAQLLKAKGLPPLLIEEHKEIGRPIHCAGLVGKRVFDEARIPISASCILNVINGAVIHLDGDSIAIRRKKVAYIIDREKFDKALGKELDILYETHFLGLEKENSHYIVETNKGEIKADVVVGADGSRSLARDFVTTNKITYLKGVQFRMRSSLARSDMVEVYVKKPYFYWIIPESHSIIRIGILSQSPYRDLLEFVKERKIKGKILERFAGSVPLVHFKPLSRERTFLVGDSASQIKPLSYGGIYMGMRAAEMLAGSIVNRKFSQYTKLWNKKFGREISIALKAREILHQLPQRDIKNIFNFVKSNISFIEKKADFENHSVLLREFLRRPKTARGILKVFFDIAKVNFKK